MRNLLTFEFALSSVLLQGLVSCSSGANIKNDTSRETVHNLHPKAETRKLTNIECLLLIKDSAYAKSDSSSGDVLHQTDLECLLDGATYPLPIINMPPWLSDKMDDNEIVSNSDSLQLSEVLFSNEGLSIPPGAQASVRQGENRRRLAGPPTGSRSVLVIRSNVNFHDEYSTHMHSTSQLSDMFFSTDGDAFNMKVFFEQCSYSALTFYPGTGDNVTNGVIDITLTELPRPQDQIHLKSLLLNAAGGWSMLSSERPPYDHTIVSYPPSNTIYHHTMTSYRNHWFSSCTGLYCESVQAQVKGLSLNWGFSQSTADSSLGNQDATDDTCMIGNYQETPLLLDPNGPMRCFNPVKSWYLGWYANRRTTIQSGDSATYRVFGITDYQTADDVVIIKIEGAEKPILVSYNRKNSFNSGTGEGGDKVLVHKDDGSCTSIHPCRGASELVAILAPGESTTVYDSFISYLNAESNHAVVRIGAAQPTTSPTPAPTQFLTSSPTTFTSSPTKNPTSSPTTWSKSPTSSPTSSPTTWSKSPTSSPTSSPTTWSKSPTSSPTQAPTSSLCVNTPGWKFIKKKNGQEKGCKWFKKRKKRCNKKAGGMENCPESCNCCEKSGVQVCENRELRKKICKSISCCTWDRDSKSCKSNVGQSKCF